MTPLMYAARKGCPQVVALLIAHGSHVNAQDENGYSVSDLLLCTVINDNILEKQEPKSFFLSTTFSEILIGIFFCLTPLPVSFALLVFVSRFYHVRTCEGCIIG